MAFGYGAEAFGTAAAQREAIDQSIARQLENQETAQLMPFNVSMMQEKLRQMQMQNQVTEEGLPYNKPMLEADLLSKNLGNKKSQTELDFMPIEQKRKLAELVLSQKNSGLREQELGIRRALLEQKLNPRFNPLDAPGAAGQLAIAKWYEDNGDKTTADLIRNAQSKSATGIDYRSMPLLDRSVWNAKARSLGIPENEAAMIYNSGQSLEQAALAKGMTPDQIANASNKFNPTTATQTQMQKREAAALATEYLFEFQNSQLDKYRSHGIFGGYSGKQIIDSFNGNDEEVGNFIAASMMQNLTAAELGRELGVDVGQHVLDELKENIPGNVKAAIKLANAKQLSIARKVFTDIGRETSLYSTEILGNPEKYAKHKGEILGRAKQRFPHLFETTEQDKGEKESNSNVDDPLGIL